MMPNGHLMALSGGVGGAKLALGFSHILAPDDLTIIANTGDDFEHLGLRISPDIDTVMYTLADVANKEVGWGQQGETWQFIEALGQLGGEDWFRLGDRDMATHIVRTEMLRSGHSLSEITRELCRRLGVHHPVVPMSDDVVSTIVALAAGGELAFQHYFVRDRCEPAVSGFRFEGIETAKPAAGFLQGLAREDLKAVVICPSNPFVSVAPMLELDGISSAMRDMQPPVVAVSPIVGGMAIKGPAAKMMAELAMPQSASGVASFYAQQYPGVLSGFVLDEKDANQAPEIEALGLETIVTNTVMLTLEDRIQLAEKIAVFVDELTQG